MSEQTIQPLINIADALVQGAKGMEQLRYAFYKAADGTLYHNFVTDHDFRVTEPQEPVACCAWGAIARAARVPLCVPRFNGIFHTIMGMNDLQGMSFESIADHLRPMQIMVQPLPQD